MGGRSGELETEETGIGKAGVKGLSTINEDVLAEDVLLDPAQFATNTQNLLSEEQGD